MARQRAAALASPESAAAAAAVINEKCSGSGEDTLRHLVPYAQGQEHSLTGDPGAAGHVAKGDPCGGELIQQFSG